jgi:hypothetical protein
MVSRGQQISPFLDAGVAPNLGQFTSRIGLFEVATTVVGYRGDLNPNSEVESVREQQPPAGARRSRRFTPRRVWGVRESKAWGTLKRPEGRAPFAPRASTSEFGLNKVTFTDSTEDDQVKRAMGRDTARVPGDHFGPGWRQTRSLPSAPSVDNEKYRGSLG